MEKQSGILGSLLKSSFAFGILAGIIEGIALLLQSMSNSPMRITGDTFESIINVFYLSVMGNIVFILIMNFTLGMVLYLIFRKFLKQYARYTFIFLSGFFMVYNILSTAFTSRYIFSQLHYPLPAFIMLRTVFYSALASTGAIILYRYIVSKWGWSKSIRVYIIINFLLLLYIPVLVIFNRIYVPYSISLKTMLSNLAIFAVFAGLYFVLSLIYRALGGKYPKTFMLENPVIPVLIFILLLSPFILGYFSAKEVLKPVTNKDRPNVILISIDTLRADALGCYGNDITDTANIDSLANQGIMFRNAYSQSPWTLTSIASFMTGLYPTVNGLNKPLLRLDSNRETIARAFRDAGYNTFAVATNGWNKTNFGMDLGFDHYYYQGDGMWILSFNSSIWYKAFVYISTNIFKSDLMYRANHPNDAQVVVDTSINKLDHFKDSNFFMWIHLLDPHDPYAPPAEYLKKYSKGYRGRYFSSSGRVNSFRTGIMMDDKDKQQIKNLYLAEVESADREIGRLMNALKEMGLEDNTIIAVIADHGEEFWEHSGVTHGHCLYWHQLHIPFVLNWKGNIEPKTIEDRVALLDLKPTLLSLCGIEAGELMQGVDLIGLIRDEDEDIKARLENRDLFAEALIYFEEQKGIFDQNYKYVYSEVSSKEELYDLQKDPGEERNIIASEEELAEKYRNTLEEWRTASQSIHESLPKEDADATAHLDEETMQQLKALGYIN